MGDKSKAREADFATELLVKLDVLQVRVLKMRLVFEAEAKEAVETNVGGPDQGEGKELWPGGEEGDGEQDSGSDVGVGEVVELSRGVRWLDIRARKGRAQGIGWRRVASGRGAGGRRKRSG